MYCYIKKSEGFAPVKHKQSLSSNESKNFTGFTLIEMIVVLGIMVALAILVIAGYQEGRPRLAVERTTEGFVNDLYRVRQRSLSSMIYEDGEDFIQGGHGMKISVNNNEYTLYAGENEEKLIEIIEVETLVNIESVSPDSEGYLNIFFSNDKKVYFNGAEATGEANIVFSVTSDETITRRVNINSSGTTRIIYE